MVLADHRRRAIARREQRPAVERVLVGQPQEGFGLLLVGRAQQRHVPRGVARPRREHVVTVGQDPDRDAPPTEAAHEAEPAVVAANDQGPLSHRAQVRFEFVPEPRMDRASAGATYSLPTTNRISGPKLQAAGAPTM